MSSNTFKSTTTSSKTAPSTTTSSETFTTPSTTVTTSSETAPTVGRKLSSAKEPLHGDVIIDNGSYNIKTGYLGQTRPSASFRNVVGVVVPEFRQNIEGVGPYFGSRAIQWNSRVPSIDMRFPVHRGIVTNWDDMEKVWSHTFHDELNVCTNTARVFLTEVIFNPKKNRRKTAEIMFEKFSVAGLALLLQPVCSMTLTGLLYGVVVECGEGVCQILPIEGGKACLAGAVRLGVGGGDVTDILEQMIREKVWSLNPNSTSLDRNEIGNGLKILRGRVTVNFEQEMKAYLEVPIEQTYTLPDGKEISLIDEPFCCTEILFQPRLFGLNTDGIHQAVYHSIVSSSEDRQFFMRNRIVLAGPTTELPGFDLRIRMEMYKYLPIGTEVRTLKLKSKVRQHGTFTGASVLAAYLLTQPGGGFASKQEYEEHGVEIVNKRF